MSEQPDYSDPVQQVRLLIADVDPDRQLLDDAQLAGFLRIEAEVPKRAAAAALDAIATSELLVSKVIRTQDLSTDGAKVAAELRARADRLRAQADDAEGGFFDVVEFGHGRGPELGEPARYGWG